MSEQERERELVDSVGSNIGKLIKDDASGQLRAGHSAILNAMISSAWSAFEALAADLWVAAVNKHPQPLATNLLEQSKEKSLTLEQLAMYSFDIKDKMGSLLKRHKKVSFEKLDDIINCYKSSFKVSKIELIGDVPDLFIAEQTRRLIAHRIGIVDDRYASHLRTKEPYCRFVVGERAQITGPMVAAQVNSCIAAGAHLLRYVDQWSRSHEQQTKSNKV